MQDLLKYYGGYVIKYGCPDLYKDNKALIDNDIFDNSPDDIEDEDLQSKYHNRKYELLQSIYKNNRELFCFYKPFYKENRIDIFLSAVKKDVELIFFVYKTNRELRKVMSFDEKVIMFTKLKKNVAKRWLRLFAI